MVRRIGAFLATRPTGARGAVARLRRLRIKRQAELACQVPRSAVDILPQLGSDTHIHVRLRADAGPAAGDFGTHASWQRRHRLAERPAKVRRRPLTPDAGGIV